MGMNAWSIEVTLENRHREGTDVTCWDRLYRECGRDMVGQTVPSTGSSNRWTAVYDGHSVTSIAPVSPVASLQQVCNKLAHAKVHCVCCVMSFPRFNYNLLPSCCRLVSDVLQHRSIAESSSLLRFIYPPCIGSVKRGESLLWVSCLNVLYRLHCTACSQTYDVGTVGVIFCWTLNYYIAVQY